MKRKRAAKGVKKVLYSFGLFTLALFMLNMIPANYVAADQTGFEVGKTWGENQKELEIKNGFQKQGNQRRRSTEDKGIPVISL